MEAKLHLYVGGMVEAKLDSLPLSPEDWRLIGLGMVELRLDHTPNVEPELRLRLAP